MECNCFAQGAALMAGKASDDNPARAYPGDRPSATILCDELNAATLGALIAFHEHRTFANGVFCDGHLEHITRKSGIGTGTEGMVLEDAKGIWTTTAGD